VKLHIEGFSQSYAASLKMTVEDGGKTKEIQIDCTDLVILRWFTDFYPSMKKERFEDGEYAWLTHSKLKDDLPILDISARACTERMQKLVKFGLLKYRFCKDSSGTFSYYTFGENFMNLQTDTPRTRSNADPVHGQADTPSTFDQTPRTRSNADPVPGQTDTKDKSIKDRSTKDNSTKDNSLMQEELFERFWNAYPRKVAKGQARKTWAKLNPDEALTERIVEAVKTAIARDNRFRDINYTPHPSTWLNGTEWENEYGNDEVNTNNVGNYHETAGGRRELPEV